jgi:hypothetical protein
MILDVVFWGCVALVLYAYIGYPCALLALGLLRDRPVNKARTSPCPFVSFIITAYNEEARIAAKLENALAQDYPADRLEIIIASDCSTDNTEDIVGQYTGRVRLIRSEERRGKEAAQQLAISAALGDILVFSDVATALAPDGITSIVSNFFDPTVGCVTSIDRFVDADGRLSGEGAYVKYEMLLRRLETRVNTVVGLSGSFFAARREVCRQWVSDRQSDFSTLLSAVDMGLRGVLDPLTAGYYRDITNHDRELQRKTRTVVRGLTVLAANVRMLNPFRYGLFAWQLASHKLCRWLVPFAMAGAFLTNALLVTSLFPIYLALFLVQLGFYAAAICGLWTEHRAFRLPAFLVMANFAVLVAWFRYTRGDRIVTWTPSERTSVLPQP